MQIFIIEFYILGIPWFSWQSWNRWTAWNCGRKRSGCDFKVA